VPEASANEVIGDVGVHVASGGVSALELHGLLSIHRLAHERARLAEAPA
jgi:hypothetical protein